MHRLTAMWMLPFACLVQAQTPRVMIDGVVINSITKAPIAGARLRLAGKGAELLSRPDVEPLFTKSDAAGHFAFTAPSPDLFLLSVEKPGAVAVSPLGRFVYVDLRLAPTPVYYAINGPGTSIENSTDRDGTVRSRVTIELSYYATIDGKVTSPEGLPMEGCVVEMFRDPIPGTQKAVVRMSGLTLITNDQGEYHAAHLDPGTYYVKEGCGDFSDSRLWKPGYWETFHPEATDIASAAPIRVAAGEHARADIRISSVKGVRITGSLIGAPPDTRVRLEAIDEFYFRFFFGVIADDRYSIENVLPGQYVISALYRGGTTGAGRRIEVSDRNLDGVDLTLRPFPDLAGTVKFPDGCLPSPVKVSLYFLADVSRVETTTDAQGGFVLRHVPPIRFGVTTSGPRRSSELPRVHLGDEVGEGGMIAFGPARSGESLEIEMPCGEARQQQ